jgi:hypothetical protein
MKPATTSAASGSRIGTPNLAPTSAAITVSDDQTSPRVCMASAIRISLLKRVASRDS